MRHPGIGTLALLLGTELLAQSPSGIEGYYVEARSNKVFGCYCEWSGEAVTSGREAVLAWDITRGEFRGVSLAGVKLVAVVVGEGTLSVGSAPRSSVVFLDGAAAKGLQPAAEGMLREQYGQLLGNVRRVYVVPIDFQMNAEQASLRIGDLVDVSMRRSRLPEDAMKGAKHWYDPFIPLTDFTLGTTTSNKYRGQDFDRRWDMTEPAITGYYGRFDLPLR